MFFVVAVVSICSKNVINRHSLQKPIKCVWEGKLDLCGTV